MLSLQDRNWSAFHLTELFDSIQRGRRLKRADQQQGEIPYVSSSALNNGVDGFISRAKGCRVFSDCISLANSGSVGSAFYEPFEFVASDHVTHLKRDGLKKEHYLFLVAALGKQASNFNFNREINDRRIQGMRVMLPIDMLGEPDWKFMEDYVREREDAQIERCREFLTKRIAGIERERERESSAARCLTPFAEKTWRSYRLSSIGDIQSGRDIYASDRMAGDTPYITSGGRNNGIGYFVANVNETLDSGYIALNRNGAVGMAFYHPYPSLMGNDCRKLHVKAADGNPHVGSFIALSISKQSECFSYSRKLGTARARALRIMLPEADDGQPDWAYMESYGRDITLRLLERQLAHLRPLL